MDCAVGERRRERLVDEPVLLDERQSRKARGRDGHLEVVARARAVVDVELGGVGKRLLEQGPERLDRHAGNLAVARVAAPGGG